MKAMAIGRDTARASLTLFTTLALTLAVSGQAHPAGAQSEPSAPALVAARADQEMKPLSAGDEAATRTERMEEKELPVDGDWQQEVELPEHNGVVEDLIAALTP